MSAALAGQSFDGESAAIRKMYDRYVAAFVKQDYAEVRECVAAPFVSTAGGALQTIGTLDAVVDYYRKLRGALEQRGYGNARITGFRITALTADRALINASYRRFKKDDSVLVDGAAVYPVCKAAGAWKLCGVMQQDAKYFGNVY
jgi:hypothetical protein